MGLAELAKDAFDEAVKAYKASIRIEGMLEVVQKAVEAFERRTTERLDSAERRTEGRLEAQEARIRELERLLASLTGKVDGALAESVQLALLQPEIQRKLAEATRPAPAAPPAPKLKPPPGRPDGSPGA